MYVATIVNILAGIQPIINRSTMCSGVVDVQYVATIVNILAGIQPIINKSTMCSGVVDVCCHDSQHSGRHSTHYQQINTLTAATTTGDR